LYLHLLVTILNIWKRTLSSCLLSSLAQWCLIPTVIFWSSKKKALTLIMLCLFGPFKLIQKWNVSSGLSSCCVLATVIVSWWFWIKSWLFYRAVLVMYRVWEIISRLCSLFHNLIMLNLSIWLKLVCRIQNFGLISAHIITRYNFRFSKLILRENISYVNVTSTRNSTRIIINLTLICFELLLFSFWNIVKNEFLIWLMLVRALNLTDKVIFEGYCVWSEIQRSYIWCLFIIIIWWLYFIWLFFLFYLILLLLIIWFNNYPLSSIDKSTKVFY